MIKAAMALLIMSAAELYFTFRYFHYAKDDGRLGREYNKQTKKPVVSLLLGVLGADLLAGSIILLTLGLLGR